MGLCVARGLESTPPHDLIEIDEKWTVFNKEFNKEMDALHFQKFWNP